MTDFARRLADDVVRPSTTASVLDLAARRLQIARHAPPTDDTPDPAPVVTRDSIAPAAADHDLQAQAERYEAIARLGNDGVWDWPVDDDMIHFSARFSEMLGLEAIETRRRPESWFRRVHPDDVARLRRRLGHCRSGEVDGFTCETRLRHADGSCRWMLVRGALVRDDAGDPRRVAGVLIDVTDQKRLERIQRKHAGSRKLALDPIACVTSRGILELIESNLDTAIRLEQGGGESLDEGDRRLVRDLIDGNRQVRGLVRWLIKGLLG